MATSLAAASAAAATLSHHDLAATLESFFGRVVNKGPFPYDEKPTNAELVCGLHGTCRPQTMYFTQVINACLEDSGATPLYTGGSDVVGFLDPVTSSQYWEHSIRTHHVMAIEDTIRTRLSKFAGPGDTVRYGCLVRFELDHVAGSLRPVVAVWTNLVNDGTVVKTVRDAGFRATPVSFKEARRGEVDAARTSMGFPSSDDEDDGNGCTMNRKRPRTEPPSVTTLEPGSQAASAFIFREKAMTIREVGKLEFPGFAESKTGRMLTQLERFLEHK